MRRRDFIVADEFAYLPISCNGGKLLFDLISGLYDSTPVINVTNLLIGEGAGVSRIPVRVVVRLSVGSA